MCLQPAGQDCWFHVQAIPRGTSTYANCELELEWWPLKECGTVIVTARGQPVGSALLDVHTVDDFVVSRDLTHGRATVPQEDSSKPSPRESQEENNQPWGRLKRCGQQRG